MKHFKLDRKQAKRLFTDKRIEVEQDLYLEFTDNQIALNIDGRLTNINSMEIEFDYDDEYDPAAQMEYLQELICEHFNIDTCDVTLIHDYGEDAEFKLRLHPDKELELVVCREQDIWQNIREFYEDTVQTLTKNQVGPYRRLGDNPYFFRWN